MPGARARLGPFVENFVENFVDPGTGLGLALRSCSTWQGCGTEALVPERFRRGREGPSARRVPSRLPSSRPRPQRSQGTCDDPIANIQHDAVGSPAVVVHDGVPPAPASRKRFGGGGQRQRLLINLELVMRQHSVARMTTTRQSFRQSFRQRNAKGARKMSKLQSPVLQHWAGGGTGASPGGTAEARVPFCRPCRDLCLRPQTCPALKCWAILGRPSGTANQGRRLQGSISDTTIREAARKWDAPMVGNLPFSVFPPRQLVLRSSLRPS